MPEPTAWPAELVEDDGTFVCWKPGEDTVRVLIRYMDGLVFDTEAEALAAWHSEAAVSSRRYHDRIQRKRQTWPRRTWD